MSRQSSGKRPGAVRALVMAASAAAMTAAIACVAETKTQDNAPMEELLAQRCTRCHDISIVKARRASAEEWHEIIERMLTNGAQVSDEEIETIVGYLARTNGPAS
jgi:cytochrome c2